jgi:methionyl-tRNA formyltransferase
MSKIENISIGFFGTSIFALKALSKLYENQVNIKFVVSQTPKPSGRGNRISDSPVGDFAKKKNLSLLCPNKLDEEFYNQISSYNIDFIVVVAYGKLLTRKILRLPKFFCLNIHASILPKWRGAAPIQRAILNSDKKTGVSIMILEENLDSGPVIMNKAICIEKNDNAGTLHEKLSVIGSELILKALEDIFNNKYSTKKQKESEATYAEKILKSETKIDWSENAQIINNKVRAFYPWPGAWTYLHKKNKKIRIKIVETEVINSPEALSKENLRAAEKNLIVKCNESYLKIKKLQPEGKKILNYSDFLNGLSNQKFFFK